MFETPNDRNDDLTDCDNYNRFLIILSNHVTILFVLMLTERGRSWQSTTRALQRRQRFRARVIIYSNDINTSHNTHDSGIVCSSIILYINYFFLSHVVPPCM